MPLGNYYVGHMNRDGMLRSARAAMDQTGDNQMIHDHVYGQPCNENCHLITDVPKGY